MRRRMRGLWFCRCAVLALLLVAAACKRQPSRGQGGGKPAAYDWSPPPPAALGSAAVPKLRTLQERREACEFKKGALPEQTIAPSDPLGQRIPIDHFVIVMQENRSFDHYFRELPKFGQPNADVAPPGYANYDPRTKRDVKPFQRGGAYFGGQQPRRSQRLGGGQRRQIDPVENNIDPGNHQPDTLPLHFVVR